jgi:tRNA 2-thiocytidine biosynthesis protein TtcA
MKTLKNQLKLEHKKLAKKLHRAVHEANKEYHIIEEGDRIMVCLSGGKDSYTMLDLMLYVQKSALINFEIIAVNLDQKQPDFPNHILPAYLADLAVEYKIITKDTYSIVMDKTPKGATMCTLCSRLRRGTLYSAAQDLGCNKLALGHHREDIVETMFLNMFFGGRLEAMPPKYRTDDGKFVVIRPLAFCKEKDIEKYAKIQNYPIIPCNLCGSQDGMQRQIIKQMLLDWDEKDPGRVDKIFKSMRNISPSHMLDINLFDFEKLESNKFCSPSKTIVSL